MYRFLRLLAYTSTFLLSGCDTLSELATGTSSAPLTLLAGAGSLTQSQEPWQLTIQGLSESSLLRQGEMRSAVTASSLTTIAVKLRLQGQDSQRTITELLATQAPTYSPEQAQNALFYHMAEAGYLQVQGAVVRPRAAYVEMTTQREQYLDVVFVFAVARQELRQASTVRFVVDNAFFLTQPVAFTLPSSQLLTVSS